MGSQCSVTRSQCLHPIHTKAGGGNILFPLLLDIHLFCFRLYRAAFVRSLRCFVLAILARASDFCSI